MNMNARYEKLLNEVQLIMEQLVETLKRQGKEHKEVSFVLVVKPLLILIPPRSFINDSRPSCDYVLSFQFGSTSHFPLEMRVYFVEYRGT